MQLSESCAHELDNSLAWLFSFAQVLLRMVAFAPIPSILMKLLRRLENPQQLKIVATEKDACVLKSTMSKIFVN